MTEEARPPEENPKTPVIPFDPVEGEPPAEAGAPAPPPTPRVFVCSGCRKGKLDPEGLKMGEFMACPECGRRTKVTLEHLMGEERASRRQQAKKAFDEMSNEERAEFLARKSGPEKLLIFVRHKLGARGVVALYLGLVVLVAAVIFSSLLASDRYTLRSIEWYWWPLTVVIGGLVGIGAHFAYVTLMYYYKKKLAAGGGSGSRRSSARRRASSTRRRPPVE